MKVTKAVRQSANRMLVELIENGLEADRRKQAKNVKRLGDQLGRVRRGSPDEPAAHRW